MKVYRAGLRRTLHDFAPIAVVFAIEEPARTPLLPPVRGDFIAAFGDDEEITAVEVQWGCE